MVLSWTLLLAATEAAPTQTTPQLHEDLQGNPRRLQQSAPEKNATPLIFGASIDGSVEFAYTASDIVSCQR